METLAVAQHRNHHRHGGRSHYHHCSRRNRGNSSAKFDAFRSVSHRNFWGNSCRTFHTGVDLLPIPLKSVSSPDSKNAFSTPPSSRTPYKIKTCSKWAVKGATSPISINFEEGMGFQFSESWAGTACSNSPPPSSLPFPMFTLRPKRTVSLDLPRLATDIDLQPTAKSAPASPTRGFSLSAGDLFDSTESATNTLRRILNLDITDG